MQVSEGTSMTIESRDANAIEVSSSLEKVVSHSNSQEEEAYKKKVLDNTRLYFSKHSVDSSVLDGFTIIIKSLTSKTHIFVSPEGKHFKHKNDIFDHYYGSKTTEATVSRDEVHRDSSIALRDEIQQLPKVYGNITVSSFGTIDNSLSFQNTCNVYPVGYKCEINIVNKLGIRGSSTASHIVLCEINKSDNEAQIILSNWKTGTSVIASSESAAWRKYCAMTQIDAEDKHSIFNLEIELLVEGLEGILDCKEYLFHFERGYGIEYFTEVEAKAHKFQLLSTVEREKRQRMRELQSRMTPDEYKKHQDGINKQNEALEKELKMLAEKATKEQKEKDKEYKKKKREEEVKKQKDLKVKIKEKQQMNSLEKKQNSKVEREKRLAEEKKMSQISKEINNNMNKLRYEASARVISVFDEEEDLIEELERCQYEFSSRIQVHLSNSNNPTLNELVLAAPTCNEAFLFPSLKNQTSNDVMYNALKDKSDWKDINWDSILQIVNYLNVFSRHMSIQIPNNLSLHDFVEYIITLTTPRTIDPYLDTHEKSSAENNFTSESMETDENHDDEYVDEVNEEGNKEGNDEENEEENVEGNDDESGIENRGENGEVNESKDEDIDNDITINHEVPPKKNTPKKIISISALDRAVFSLDRLHLSLIKAISNEFPFPVTAAKGNAGDSDDIPVKLPLNQLTWTEVARMSLISLLLKDLGKTDEDIKLSIIGSKHHSYRTGKEIIRQIRYRLAIQQKIYFSEHCDKMELTKQVVYESNTNLQIVWLLYARVQNNVDINELYVNVLDKIIKNNVPGVPHSQVLFESEADLTTALNEIINDNTYHEMYHRCCKVLLKVIPLYYSKSFLWEVDSGLYPDYYTTIAKPVMLANIATNIINKHYSIPGGDEEVNICACFYRDVLSVATNCCVYNTELIVLSAHAHRLFFALHRHIDRWLLSSSRPAVSKCNDGHCLLTNSAIPEQITKQEVFHVKCSCCSGTFSINELHELTDSGSNKLSMYLFLPNLEEKNSDWYCPLCLEENSFVNNLSDEKHTHTLNEWGFSTSVPWSLHESYSKEFKLRCENSPAIRTLYDALQILVTSPRCSNLDSIIANNITDSWSFVERIKVILGLCELLLSTNLCCDTVTKVKTDCEKLTKLMNAEKFRRGEFLDIIKAACGDKGFNICRELLDGSNANKGDDDDDPHNPIAGICMICKGSTYEDDLNEDDDVMLCDGCNGEAHMKCLGLTEIPDSDWHCSYCLNKLQNQTNPEEKDDSTFNDLSEYRSVEIEDELFQQNIQRKENDSDFKRSATEIECAYCGYYDDEICSPMVVGQSREEYDLCYGLSKTGLTIPPNGHNLLGNGSTNVQSKQPIVVRLMLEGVEVGRPKFNVPYFPLTDNVHGDKLLQSNSSILKSPIVHECCALEMFQHRVKRNKHMIRRRRIAVANKALSISGISSSPLGKDNAGREYWTFSYTDFLFVACGVVDETEAELRAMLEALKPNSDDVNTKCVNFEDNKNRASITWKVFRTYGEIRNIVDSLGKTSKEQELKKQIVTTLLVGKKSDTTEDIKINDSSKENDDVEMVDSTKINQEIETANYNKRVADRCNTPHALKLFVGSKGQPINDVYYVKEESAFEDIPEHPDSESQEYFDFAKSKYYAIGFVNEYGKKVTIPKNKGTVYYQLHREDVLGLLINSSISDPWTDGIFYFLIPIFKRAGKYIISFHVVGDEDYGKVKPLSYSITVIATSVCGGIPNAVKSFNAKNYIYSSQRHMNGKRLDFTTSNEFNTVKSLLYALYFALPVGSVMNSDENETDDIFNRIAWSSGWNENLDRAWKNAMERASTPTSLMECLLLLEYYINTKWYISPYDEFINMLPAPHFAIRSATISSVALRIYCLDACLDYKKVQLPTRPKRSDERRTSYASVLAPEKKEASSTVFTSSGRKSKMIVSYVDEFDEDKVAKRQKKQNNSSDYIEPRVRDGLRNVTRVNYAYNETDFESENPHHNENDVEDLYDYDELAQETLNNSGFNFDKAIEECVKTLQTATEKEETDALDLNIRYLSLLRMLHNDLKSWLFWKPVSDDEVPGYSKIIKNPMDLGTIANNVIENTRLYLNPESLNNQVKLVWSNCMKFNDRSTSFYGNAKVLAAKFNKYFTEWVISEDRPPNPDINLSDTAQRSDIDTSERHLLTKEAYDKSVDKEEKLLILKEKEVEEVEEVEEIEDDEEVDDEEYDSNDDNM